MIFALFKTVDQGRVEPQDHFHSLLCKNAFIFCKETANATLIGLCLDV